MERLRRRSPTLPLWVFAFALLLRAAMPFLAHASADLQGRALSEVCSVYGVAHDTKGHDAPVSAAGDHCVLNALAALGTTGAPPPGFAATSAQGREAPPVASPPLRRPDATATWVARRKQGPPALA